MPNLLPEELSEVLAFVEGPSDAQINPETLLRFYSLHSAVQKKIFSQVVVLRGRNSRLQKKVDKAAEKENMATVPGGFTDTGIDSYDLATALLYQLQQTKTYSLTLNKLILILFEMYSSWLSSKKERICTEHPVHAKYGPMFWRVYNRMRNGSLKTPVPYESWKEFAAGHPSVAAYVRNAARKYFDYPESELRDVFNQSDLCRSTMPESNNGKWNKELPDEEIYKWKTNTR